MVDKRYFSVFVISTFALIIFSGLVSAGWWEDFQNSIHLSPGCTLPSASSGQFTCMKGAVWSCNSGAWAKINNCGYYVSSSWGFIDPCVNSVARSSELLARNDCSECGGQSEKCCVGNLQCRGSLSCQSGYCTAAATCTNDCTTNGQRECSGNGVKVCSNYDSDTCLEWGPLTYCPTGTTCQSGQCVVATTCTNDCTSSGYSECTAGNTGRKTCGNFDSDSCLEWSSTALCSPGQTCYGGECATPSSPPEPQTSCLNDCPATGKSECVGANARRTCGHYDSDICLEWSSTVLCGPGQTCMGDGDCHTVSNANACTSVGTIQNGKYCSVGLTWEKQKGQGSVCESNFECTTNVCYSGRCASAGFAEWLRNVFRNLFGGQ